MTNVEINAELDKMTKMELKVVVRQLLRTRLYVDGVPWNEGNWFYRDHESGKLFLVPAFKPGISIVVAGWESGVLVAGVVGEQDPKDRNHAVGREVITSLDKLGDFESPAEKIQGKRL